MNLSNTTNNVGAALISVARDGQEIGEWTEERVFALYREGQLFPSDYYWKEGMMEWRELSFLRPSPPAFESEALNLPPIPSTVVTAKPPPLPGAKVKSRGGDFNKWDIILPLVAATLFGAVLEAGNAWARTGLPPDPVLALSFSFGQGLVAAVMGNMFGRVAKRPMRWVVSVGFVLAFLAFDDLHWWPFR